MRTNKTNEITENNLQEIVDIADTSKQTPIEVALKIDEDGMTTLSTLYSFLGLSQAHYKRWYVQNIINNDFAVENVDYVVLHNDSKIGRPTLDFKLTIRFAKQLSATVRNIHGQQAMNYFEAYEHGFEMAMIKMQNMLYDLDKRLSALEKQVGKTNKAKKLPDNELRRWKTEVFNKLYSVLDCLNSNSDKEMKLSGVIALVIKEMSETYRIDVNDYTDRYITELRPEKEPYILDVIHHYKDADEMFSCTLDSIIEKLHIKRNTEIHEENVFDEVDEVVESDASVG